MTLKPFSLHQTSIEQRDHPLCVDISRRTTFVEGNIYVDHRCEENESKLVDGEQSLSKRTRSDEGSPHILILSEIHTCRHLIYHGTFYRDKTREIEWSLFTSGFCRLWSLCSNYLFLLRFALASSMTCLLFVALEDFVWIPSHGTNSQFVNPQRCMEGGYRDYRHQGSRVFCPAGTRK